MQTLSKICVIDGNKILDNLERKLLHELSKEEYKKKKKSSKKIKRDDELKMNASNLINITV